MTPEPNFKFEIDPYSSLNANHVTNWRQVDDIKLLIRLKLQDNGYKLDHTMERNLENFIKHKQKQEMQKKLLRKKGDFYGTA